MIEITSPEAGQGKSTVVANLAVAFSRIGIEMIVLDADLRRPRQHEIFGLDNSSGLSTMLALGRKPELKPAGQGCGSSPAARSRPTRPRCSTSACPA